MPARRNRWLPFAVLTSIAAAIWALAAAHGYAWQLIWLPAVVAAGAWPARGAKDTRAVPAAAAQAPQRMRTRIRLLGIAAAALGLTAACSPDTKPQARRAAVPRAPLSSLHGRIAYSARGGDIWVMNANGTGRRRITRSGRGTDSDPDFSPDGQRIVFRTSRGRYAPTHTGSGLKASSSSTSALGASSRSSRAPAAASRPGHLTAARSPSADFPGTATR